ncbi:MAG TPA: sensor histidine kinase [Pseudonocardiaceae bacterium]|jgi:two-component system sensor histidine kinase DesK|nr:sensor histidine kinase [Pseudonocardiaceae bacterium]
MAAKSSVGVPVEVVGRSWLRRHLRPGAGGTGYVVGILALLGLASYMVLIASYPLRASLVGSNPTEQVGSLIAFVLWIGSYIFCTVNVLRGRRHERRMQVLSIAALGLALLGFIVLGQDWASPAALSFSVMLLCLSGRARGIATVVLLGGYLAATVKTFDGPDVIRNFEEFALSTLIFYSIPRLVVFARELEDTRAELAGAAVSEQRLRWARDLHDTLGHGLSVVVLKLELAERLADRDDARAIAELREARALLRDSIGEMQTVVAGMRDTSLAGEIASARTILNSVGVRTQIELDPIELDQPTSQALAWIVREGATNVLRHSDSTVCKLRLRADTDQVVLELASDGQPIATRRVPSGGHGLRGMRERLAELDGDLEAAAQPGGGFLVRACLPLPGAPAQLSTTSTAATP